MSEKTKGELREGYIAKWNEYPNDEIKFRVARPSVLGPSLSLLGDYKNGRIGWGEYERRFRQEMSRTEAKKRITEVREMLREGKNVRLICFEKNPPCHRFILMELVKEAQTVE